MKAEKNLITICGLILALALTGCKRTPEDIRKWKADGNITKLVSATGDPRQFMRLDAIEALAELQNPDAIAPLSSLFTDSDKVIVHEAAAAIADIGGPLSEEPMLRALTLETYPARQTAAIALGELKSAKAVEPLIKVLDDPYEDVVLGAVAALGKIGDPAAVPALCEKIQKASTRVKLSCAASLSQLGGEHAAKGLVPVFSELNPEIREIAVHAFIELGDPAIPYAYDALRGGNEQIQSCGLSILQGLDAVPAEGADAVWYLLAQSCSGKGDGVDPEAINRLVEMGTAALPALLEGVASPLPKARETAFLPLELLGEPAAKPALEAAESRASKKALDWLEQRDTWRGAPSWRLDLWGAAAALSPDFTYDPGLAEELSNEGPDSSSLVIRSGFRPTREYIPALILQLESISTRSKHTINFFGISIESRSEIPTLARKSLLINIDRLKEAGSTAVFPLIAGLGDDDPQVSDGCAHVLGLIGDRRAVAPLTDHLEKKIAAGESLTFSPFYTALQRLNDPSAKEVLIKVRPNVKRAELLFKETYPDAEVLHLAAVDLHAESVQPAAYTISYSKAGKTAELTITFRRTKYGDWIPYPPLPDALPE